MLRQPEFARTEQARQVLEVLEEGRLEDILGQLVMPYRGVQVVIGGEGRWEGLQDCGLVLARYGLTGGALGVVGVLGPVRMRYDRAVPAVRYVADLMTAFVRQVHG